MLHLKLMRYPPGQGKFSLLYAVAAYGLIGSLWIVITNHMLALAVDSESALSAITLFCNVGFVVVTSGIMYRLNRWTQNECLKQAGKDFTTLEQECDHLREKIVQQSEELFRLQEILQHKPSGSNPNTSKLIHATPKPHDPARSLEAIQIQDIEQAFARQEFVLHYQPIVTLNSSRIIGFESLIRWHHPQLGLIMPGDFIPLVESSDLIIPIGEWVLEQACTQAQSWRQEFPDLSSLIISVNLSSKQFNQPNLVNQIATVLEKTKLPPPCLKLEITETAIMQDAESAIAMLTKLHQMGVKLSIDDFGTGYSSLSYLYYFPVDSLKVDRSFISRIDKDGEQVELVRTVLTLAWNLGLTTIAEGIETPTQLAQLKALHCEYGQGFFFNKPLPCEEVSELLKGQNGKS